MLMSVKTAMEGAIRHAPTLMAHLNAPVAQDILWQSIILTVMVRFADYRMSSPSFDQKLVAQKSTKPPIEISRTGSIFNLSDINECHTKNGGCNQTCTNTDGSFECSCGTGFTLTASNVDCSVKFKMLLGHWLQCIIHCSYTENGC